ncbi:MAG: hypothetical protein LBM75_09680 [Myxococcales bacterium]|jgi:hypothetical protein|nr:hypothetical protein [Myxococcales bacterium]
MNVSRRLSRFALIAIALLMTVACAGRSLKVEPAAVQRVHSVAIVGFDTYLSTEIGSKLAKLIGPDLLIQTLASGWVQSGLSPIDSKMPYEAFAQRLSQELGVRVLTHEALTQNPAYAELYRTLASEHSVGNLRIDGILSGDAARNLSRDQREALRAALGVDALMAVETSYWIDATDTVSAVGGEKLWARIDFALFSETDEPIWRDQADGDLSKKGLPPLVRQEAIAELKIALAQATDNALSTLFSHLNQRCPECSKPTATQATAAAETPESAQNASVSADVPAAPEQTSQTSAAPAPAVEPAAE